MSVVNINDIPELNLDLQEYEDIFNLYKADLMAFIDSVTKKKNLEPFEQRYLLNKLEEKWQPLLGFNTSKILTDIADLQTPKTGFVESLNLTQALSYCNEGANWVIPNLLRNSSMYILAGEPKAGKSLLIYFLIHAIAVTGNFLGRPTKKGRVLYIQLEESLETMGERFFMCGFGDENDEDSQIVVNFTDRVRIERKFDITTDINKLIKLIQEYQPTLVVIDSLRAATLNTTASENSNEFGKLVYQLQQIFNLTQTCAVIIHHMNKTTQSAGQSVVGKVAGHGSIVAACAGIIGLTSEETDRGRVMSLKTLPRDGTPITIKYVLQTEDDGLWKLEKIFEDTPLSSPVTSRVLRFLADRQNEKFTYKQIASALHYSGDDSSFRLTLKYLQTNRLITSEYANKQFKYWLPQESLWLVENENLKELLTEQALDASKLLRCKSKDDLRLLISDWGANRKKLAAKELSPVERTRIVNLIESWEYEVGDEVVYCKNVYVIESRESNKASLLENKYKLKGLDELVNETDLNMVEEDEEVIIPILAIEAEVEDYFEEV
jgi:KaiC/GvpD/RAD55 family RecA-like ATPase